MLKEDLLDYLEGTILWSEMQEKIWKELADFEKNLLEVGRSATIFYHEGNERTVITSKHLSRLCEDYLNGSVKHIFLSYCADALLLSEHTTFETPVIQEHLEELTDFDINGPLTDERVRTILFTI